MRSSNAARIPQFKNLRAIAHAWWIPDSRRG
jgi:hypothetical protein